MSVEDHAEFCHQQKKLAKEDKWMNQVKKSSRVGQMIYLDIIAILF